jgi:hypothetical protein
MNTADIARTLAGLFAELSDGTSAGFGPFILNTGDAGLLRSLDLLSADDASQSSNGGATIAAHALHVTYGLSLMNRWAREGGNPFADATWDAAWTTSVVDDARWDEIRRDLRKQVADWIEILRTPREVRGVELGGMIGSIAHFAYHLGAIRQITRIGRGPKEGTFAS